LAEAGEDKDRVLVDHLLVDVLGVDIRFHILAEHHVLL
jgi:hypothetical protein